MFDFPLLPINKHPGQPLTDNYHYCQFNFEFNMGNQESSGTNHEEVHQDVATEMETSTGFHFLEIHLPTAGMGMGLLIILAILLCCCLPILRRSGRLWRRFRRVEQGATIKQHQDQNHQAIWMSSTPWQTTYPQLHAPTTYSTYPQMHVHAPARCTLPRMHCDYPTTTANIQELSDHEDVYENQKKEKVEVPAPPTSTTARTHKSHQFQWTTAHP